MRDVYHLDDERREILFAAAGTAAPDEDPDVCKPALVSLDEESVTILSDDPGDHIGLAARRMGARGARRHRRYSDSCVGRLAGRQLLRRNCWQRRAAATDGASSSERRKMSPSSRPPRTAACRRAGSGRKPSSSTAADGPTDTYGVLFAPSRYEHAASYPLIDLIYGGPQLSYVPTAFAHGGFGTDLQLLEAAHLSTLGAFVLLTDGRGTAGRERAFRQSSYGVIHTASNIDDHVTGIQELAERYPEIDLERVAVCGFSGGGYATAMAALRRGDFFKVAIAGGGNYDQRLFWHTWGERYHGAFDADHYATQAAKTYAAGLSGKLLLIYGPPDAACPPAGIITSCSRADEGKDVDIVLEPHEGHRLGGYALRRRLDYLVTHLFRSTPPTGAQIAHPFDDALAPSSQSRSYRCPMQLTVANWNTWGRSANYEARYPDILSALKWPRPTSSDSSRSGATTTTSRSK